MSEVFLKPPQQRSSPSAEPVAYAAARPGLLMRLTRTLMFRRVLTLVVLALVWEIAARIENNPLLLPSFTETASAFVEASLNQELLSAAGASLLVLLKGYGLALVIATVLVSLAVANGFLRDMLQTVAAMLSPLPAVALLPLAMLWFGLGEKSLLFVLANAVIWPFALAALQGFDHDVFATRIIEQSLLRKDA